MEQRQNTLRELKIFSRYFGRSMHYFREQGSTDPGASMIERMLTLMQSLFALAPPKKKRSSRSAIVI